MRHSTTLRLSSPTASWLSSGGSSASWWTASGQSSDEVDGRGGVTFAPGHLTLRVYPGCMSLTASPDETPSRLGVRPPSSVYRHPPDERHRRKHPAEAGEHVIEGLDHAVRLDHRKLRERHGDERPDDHQNDEGGAADKLADADRHDGFIFPAVIARDGRVTIWSAPRPQGIHDYRCFIPAVLSPCRQDLAPGSGRANLCDDPRRRGDAAHRIRAVD